MPFWAAWARCSLPSPTDSVDATNPTTLRATLHTVIDDHQRFPYTSGGTDTWDILNLADEDPNNPNNILDVYKNASYPKISGGMRDYNREHTWPKSYGFPNNTLGPYTDCHMLFLSDDGYNFARSNHPYRNCHAACNENPTNVNNGQGGGGGEYPGNSNWRTGQGPVGTWETWIGRRGDVARALFYMDVRYEGGASEPDLILTDDNDLIVTTEGPVAYMGILSVLLEWHTQDPVDDVEHNRNDVVFSFQGNRNPFIDHPKWVACLFLDECDFCPDASCTADLDCDGDVDAADLAELLAAWGPCEKCCDKCGQDFDGDGHVDAADLAQLLGAWGPCPAIACLDPKTNPTDLNCGASASCEVPDEPPIEMDLCDCDCLEGATEEQCCDAILEGFEAECEGYGGILLYFGCGCLP